MKTLHEVVRAFPQKVINQYDFSSAVYTGALNRITGVICQKHGEFSQYAAQFRKGCGCPACGAEKRNQKTTFSQAEFILKVSKAHNGVYDYSPTIYKNMNSPISVICPQHGIFTISANHHYYRKQGCPTCAHDDRKVRILTYRHLAAPAKISNTAKDFFIRCTEKHEGKYTYPDHIYRGAKYKIKIECPRHGLFEQAAWDHLSGKGCAGCGAADPKWEIELSNILQGFGLTVERNSPILSNGKQVDVYVPEDNFGVELHGLYWHTEQFRHTHYHRDKWEDADKLGIRLFQVFEDEWAQEKDKVISRIKAVLGFSEIYDARKCKIVTLNPSTAKQFLEEKHTQGAGVARLFYGLEYKGGLVAVATFAPARGGAMVSAKGATWEVVRYASKGRVRGGFTRLFAYFKKQINPLKVISYCDLRYGTGGLYSAAGFVLDSVTPPDYWWVPAGKIERIPRYRTQKHKLATHPILRTYYSQQATEVEICKSAGWNRIYGVGSQKWVWEAS